MLVRTMRKDLEKWLENGREALLITGARQIGKTFLIREVLKSTKTPYVELNLIEHPEYVEVLEKSSDSEELYMRLSVLSGESLIKHRTIIFFDEVQEYKEIVTRIKFLVDEGSYRYIMSGSLLGVELRDLRSAPVGYLRIEDMYPMSQEEFLRAVGVSDQTIEMVRESFHRRKPIDGFVHKKLLEVFYLYLIVGGMPEAVQTYVDTHDMNRVASIHEKIIRLYKQDFTKYETRYKLKLMEIYDAIPGELNEKNKRFFINHLGKGRSYERLQDDFLWLKYAGVALPVYNVTELKAPLRINEKRNLFKLFLSDVGLLTSLYPVQVKIDILRQATGVNNGALFENAAAQELKAKGFSLYYYNSKKYGELDFVLEVDGKVLPLEIKSGKDYARHKAMDNVLANEATEIEAGYVFSRENVSVKGRCCYLPIYMLFCIENTRIDDFTYTLDLSGI